MGRPTKTIWSVGEWLAKIRDGHHRVNEVIAAVCFAQSPDKAPTKMEQQFVRTPPSRSSPGALSAVNRTYHQQHVAHRSRKKPADPPPRGEAFGVFSAASTSPPRLLERWARVPPRHYRPVDLVAGWLALPATRVNFCFADATNHHKHNSL